MGLSTSPVGTFISWAGAASFRLRIEQNLKELGKTLTFSSMRAVVCFYLPHPLRTFGPIADAYFCTGRPFQMEKAFDMAQEVEALFTNFDSSVYTIIFIPADTPGAEKYLKQARKTRRWPDALRRKRSTSTFVPTFLVDRNGRLENKEWCRGLIVPGGKGSPSCGVSNFSRPPLILSVGDMYTAMITIVFLLPETRHEECAGFKRTSK